eukprot:6437857-Pyramimonas_sp.AAC.1
MLHAHMRTPTARSPARARAAALTSERHLGRDSWISFPRLKVSPGGWRATKLRTTHPPRALPHLIPPT